MRRNPRSTRTVRGATWQIAAALMLMAAGAVGGAALQAARHPDRSDSDAASPTVAALVDTHVRAMLPGHLLDVQSTDRHTVKPWFAGRVDIAPPVPDLASSGFPLLGGRLDYVQGHTAAALVYGYRRHTVELYVWRVTPGEPAQESRTQDGYAILHWTAGTLSYWAVTDALPSTLSAFRVAYTNAP